MYQVAQKNVPLDKMLFLNNQYIFTSISGFIADVFKSLKILLKYFHYFKNYSFYIFYSVFQNYAEEMDSHL